MTRRRTPDFAVRIPRNDHLAVVKRQRAAAELLIALGCDIEALDAAGLSALDQAALEGRMDLAQMLINRGAQIRLPAAVALDRPADIERLVRPEPNSLAPGQRFGALIIRAAADRLTSFRRSSLICSNVSP